MILFLEDYKRYPGVIIDVETSNRSFVELAAKYKMMGIKNYFFMLALHNPMLKGVDPYSPDLSEEMKAAIDVECRVNPWYFFREVFRLPSQGSPIPDPLRANRGNIGAYWLYFNHVDVAVTQPRQTGKSVGADGLNTYITQVAGRHTTFSLITKDHALRSSNIQRLKDMRDILPPYLNPYIPKEDTNNPMGITAIKHHNEVLAKVAQSSIAGALNLGRGNTSPNNQNDEGPFCKNIHITIPAFLSAGTAARANAKRNKSFYGNIYTTTAGKLDTEEGAYMYSLFKGGMDLNEPALFDCKDEDALHAVVNSQSKYKPLVYINLSHKQLGLTDEWLYRVMLDSASTGDAADRDYMNRWTTGSLSSPLSQRVNDAIKESIRQASYIQITPKSYLVNWYIPESEIAARLSTGKFVLGNDCAEGLGENRDSITLYLTDAFTLETIMTVSVQESNVYYFIEWLCNDIMLKYPNIVINPERKSVGVVLIDMLIVKLISMGINPFRRIYNTVVEDGLFDTDDEFRFIYRPVETWPSWVATKYKSKFGYGTAGQGRHKRDNLYVETLTRAADLTCGKIADPMLSEQLTKLVVRGGRIDHAAGGHDDMVIAYLLAMWFLLHSKNLEFYGITNPAGGARGLTEIYQEQAAPKGWARVESKESVLAQERIDLLLEELENTDDDAMVIVIESQIRALSRRVVNHETESRSVDDLLNKAKEARYGSKY